ncbi:thiamine diphosphokinase [Aestuariivirga litoralis]|uniref:thiamine diphosphokinase n=1 Tax=Aestuariivirga litoralis TaxID=2650924 RepID=UPI0018C7F9C1|nr:thiamine diphosphokinase [Aestuariivirga litoralis]MBG1232039.1 thiamine diphosphokinase [Aestuariivirga litoralis]
MSKFAILLGGNITPTKRLAQQLEGARVIAADHGMVHAKVLGLQPELWVGDFDSTDAALAALWPDVPRQTHPAAKDASDGELAISEAFRRGATSLVLVGGFGGQLDHVLAHAGFLLAFAKRGVDAFMTSGTEEARGLADELEFHDLTSGTRLSVMPFTDLAGLHISGVKWPLTNKTVLLGTAFTLANVTEGDVKISLRAGSALVLTYV